MQDCNGLLTSSKEIEENDEVFVKQSSNNNELSFLEKRKLFLKEIFRPSTKIPSQISSNVVNFLTFISGLIFYFVKN